MKYFIVSFLLVFHVLYTNAQNITGIEQTPNLEDGFYLHGEVHFQQSSFDLLSGLSKYYVEKRNVRNIVLEIGYVESILINEYLESGNEALVCGVFNTYVLPHSMYFLRHLREIHLKQKIKVLGVDQFSTFTSWFTFLNKIIGQLKLSEFTKVQQELFKDVIKHYNVLKDLGYHGLEEVVVIEELYSIKQRFKSDFETNTIQYQNLLSEEEFTDLLLVLQTDAMWSLESKSRDGKTNKRWIEHLNLFIKYKKVFKGNYFGQFGLMHIKHFNNSFAQLLNSSKNSPFNNNVCLVHNRYINGIKAKPLLPHEEVYKKDNNYEIIYTEFEEVKEGNPKKWLKFSDRVSTYELINRDSFKNYPYAFIMLIRDDKPIHLKWNPCRVDYIFMDFVD